MGKFFSWLGELFKSCFDGIIGFFVGLWDLFWSILCGIGQFFIDCWNYLWDWIQWGFYSAIDWILCQFVGLLDVLAENLNIEFDLTQFEQLFQAVSFINHILPLDTFLLCGAFYFSFLLIWVVYKFVKSWIPAVSGT